MPILKDGTIVPEIINMPKEAMPDTILARALANSFKCENGHILGVIVREKVHHDHTVPRLTLFRGALDPSEPANHAIPFAKIDGGEILCGLCGSRRFWHPGQDYIESLKAGKQ